MCIRGIRRRARPELRFSGSSNGNRWWYGLEKKGIALKRALQESLDRFDEVGDIRGRRFFIGIEFVSNRATKQPFPADGRINIEIGRRAFQSGLICHPCAGNASNGLGDTVIVAPPYTATEDELAELVAKLTLAVEGTFSAR